MKTTPTSATPEIMAQNANSEAEKVNYPISQSTGLRLLKTMMKGQDKMSISRKCLETLIDVSYNWIIEHRSCTCYALCEGDRQKIMFMHQRLIKLQEMGYIDVVAVGQHNSKSYAPTALGLSMLKPLVSVA